jgi:cyanate lyase
MTPIMSRAEAGDLVRSARVRARATWAELADKVGAPVVWTTSALLGSTR